MDSNWSNIFFLGNKVYVQKNQSKYELKSASLKIVYIV